MFHEIFLEIRCPCLQSFIDTSAILYADKTRTANWAMAAGLQLPVALLPNGGTQSINSGQTVAQSDGFVKSDSQISLPETHPEEVGDAAAISANS